MLNCIPLTEDTIIVKCVRLTVQLLDKTPGSICVDVFRSALRYSIAFIKEHKFVGICDALRLMQALIKNHFKNDNLSIGDESKELFQSTQLLVNLIDDPEAMQKSASCHYDGYSIIEIKSSAVLCLETILLHYEKLPEISQCLEQSITRALLKLIYSVQSEEVTERIYCNVMRAALNSCRFIGFANREWCTENIGDILGACVSNMLFGLPNIVYHAAQRIQSSQQTIQDTYGAGVSGKKGGKLMKSRRPRQTPQYKNRKVVKSSDTSKGKSTENDDIIDHFEQLTLLDSTRFEISNFTTSDSDASDTESARAGNYDREKEAKLRLAAISLIAIVAKVHIHNITSSYSFFILFLSFFFFAEC